MSPKKDCSLVGELAVGRSQQAWNLEGSVLVPLVVKTTL